MYNKENYPTLQISQAVYGHFNEEYAATDDMTIGDRLDLLNDDIESLTSVVNDSEESDEKLDAIALMVNKARLYTALSNVGNTK